MNTCSFKWIIPAGILAVSWLTLCESQVSAQNPAPVPEVALAQQVASLRKELQDLKRSEALARNDITALQRLAQEFSSELAMLGSDTEQLKKTVGTSTTGQGGYLCVTAGGLITTFKVESNGKPVKKFTVPAR